MVRRALVLLLPFLVLGAACSDDEPTLESASSSSTSSTSTPSTETSKVPAGTNGVPPASVTTTPTGKGEPLAGDEGTGDIDYTLAPERSEFCYRISVKGLGEVTEAHVHRTSSEVVLGLRPPAADGTVNTCAATDALLIEEMAATPKDFYIDVHGARGVLKASL